MRLPWYSPSQCRELVLPKHLPFSEGDTFRLYDSIVSQYLLHIQVFFAIITELNANDTRFEVALRVNLITAH